MNKAAILFDCMYCGYSKPQSDSTLEHGIPQALGGAHAPDRFKFRNICTKCNNDLGAYVDASFAKSWFVINGLATAAKKLYDGANDVPVPPVCMGPIEIPGLQLADGQIAESWLGPSGEHLIWVRLKDETLYWYSGGNPRHRREASTVYWFPTSDDPRRWRIGMESLFAAFKSHKNTRKVMGVRCEGFPGNGYPPGFDVPNDTDIANIAAIRAQNSGFRGQIALNAKFDLRFLSKLGLAVGYGLFGDAFLPTQHATEFRKGCWPKKHSHLAVRGASMFGAPTPELDRFLCYPGAVVLSVMRADDQYCLVLSVDQGRSATVSLAPANLKCAAMDIEEGYCLLLFPSLRHYVETTVANLIGHRSGTFPHPDLALIDQRLARAERFWAALPPLPTRPL